MILGMLCIVVGLVFQRSIYFKTIASYVGLSAEGKIRVDMQKGALVFRNAMIFVGVMLILGETLGYYFEMPLVNIVFVATGIVSGIAYFVFNFKN